MTSASLHIEAFCLGDWMTNCFVLHLQSSTSCWIVDVGFEPAAMIQYVQQNRLEPKQIVLTHAHVDHIAGLEEFHKVWPQLPILIHEHEASFLTKPELNLSSALAEPVIAPPSTGVLRGGDTMELEGTVFEIRHTPGHSPGGITLYSAVHQVALVGDALFAGSIGRTDFPTSNHRQMLAAIDQQLMTLPDETRVLSGHGPETTIGHERITNPFLT